MAKDQIYDKRIGCMVPAYPARFTIKYKGLRVEHDGHGALAFAVGPRVADVYDEDVHHSGRPISKNEMVVVAKRIVDAHPKWIAQAKNGDTSQKIFSAGSTRKSPKAKPKPQKVFLKGGVKEKTSRGVSYLVNVVSDAVEINTVARFRSWDDASSSMGGLYGFQSYQGVPMTQEELTAHYPELKRYTGLTKSKIGSAKVWFKNIDMPLVVQYKGYAYMVAPTIEDAKAFRQVPESMTKPKLTAEQRKYLDAHKREDVAGCWQEIEFFQVGIEEAIREAKHLQKQGKRVQIGVFAPTGGRPLYTVMVLMGGSAGGGVAAKPKPATKPPRTPAPSVPVILTPAPAAASDMASVPVRLGGGGIAPIPGVGAGAAKPAAKAATKKPKPPAKKAAAPPAKSKAKKAAAKPAKAKNGKPAAGIVLTAAQKKRLAAKGSVTIKRDGKFVTVRG